MNVPRLKFKDGNGQEFSAWKEKPLQEVCKINQGLQIPISERFTDKGEGRHFYITNEFLKKDSNVQYFIENPPSSVLCTESDVLMTRTGNTGKVVTGVNGAFHNNFFKISYDKAVLNKIFLCEFLSREKTQSLILKLAGTSTIPDLNHSDFYKITIQFPSLPEQTKIANFLTAIDEKISQLTQKYDLLKQYKKGVMQQIFSQKLRFKDDDGREFPEWEEKKIGDITDKVIAGGTPSTLKKDYWHGDVRWMNSGELNLKRVYEVENRITELGVSKSSTKLIPPKCILIGLAGQGKTRGTVAMNMIELCINQSIAAIQPKPSIFNEEFLYQNLDYRYDEIRGLSTGDGGRGGLNLQIIKSIDILLPFLSEQTKIANFLTAIDDKITHTKTQLDAVKRYKKSLLQQLFV